MTLQHHYNAFLRQVSTSPTTGSAQTRYPLSTSQSTVIGRDTNSCQIVLDSAHYQGVSRHHAEIQPLQTTGGSSLWQVCDLGSANGTYVNHQRLQGCQTLQAGDIISMGKHGAEFIFEYQGRTPVHHARPLNIQPSDSLHLSQVLPVFSMRQDLRWKKLMIPGAITILFVVLMFYYIQVNNPVGFMYLLGFFLAIAGYYVIYQLCGKSKPGWVLLVAALVTMLLLKFPDLNSNGLGDVFDLFAVVFIHILPGGIEAKNFPTLFIHMLFGAGLIEELFKAIPILAALYIGVRLQSPWRERIGVWEPLDGILLGAASAVGFTLVETLVKYVPETMQQAGVLTGFMLLIPRIVGSVAGHMAYSGYFGYFIGLSVLKPSKRWQLLGIGYLTAAIIHALWNSMGSLASSPFMYILLQAVPGLLAFAFLIAAILKARQLSPTRSQNFATQYRSPNSP